MTALAAIGPIIGAMSSIFSGVMGMAQGRYQAQVAEMNAKIAQENAVRAVDRSQIEQQNQDMLSLAALGEIETGQAGSGLMLNSQSFRRSRASARTLGRLDALNVRQAGEIEAYNYKTDAMNFNAQAGASRMEGMGSLLGGFLGGFGSLIGKGKMVRDPNKYDQGYGYGQQPGLLAARRFP